MKEFYKHCSNGCCHVLFEFVSNIYVSESKIYWVLTSDKVLSKWFLFCSMSIFNLIFLQSITMTFLLSKTRINVDAVSKAVNLSVVCIFCSKRENVSFVSHDFEGQELLLLNVGLHRRTLRTSRQRILLVDFEIFANLKKLFFK